MILSTHIVQDVEQLCRRLAIIDNGRVLFTGTPQEARTPFAGRLYAGPVAKPELPAFRAHHTVLSERLVMGQPHVHLLTEPTAPPTATPPQNFKPVAPDLEDVFFAHIAGATVNTPTPA